MAKKEQQSDDLILVSDVLTTTIGNTPPITNQLIARGSLDEDQFDVYEFWSDDIKTDQTPKYRNVTLREAFIHLRIVNNTSTKIDNMKLELSKPKHLCEGEIYYKYFQMPC